MNPPNLASKKEISERKRIYRKYLQSDHWKSLRENAIRRDSGKCVECGSGHNLQVHHKEYRAPLESGVLADVLTLCRNCHRIEHGLWVKYSTPFEALHYALEKKMRVATPSTGLDLLPVLDEDMALAVLAETPEDERTATAFYREKAGMRMILTSPRMWASWLSKKKEVRLRLFDWSQQKFNNLKSLSKNG